MFYKDELYQELEIRHTEESCQMLVNTTQRTFMRNSKERRGWRTSTERNRDGENEAENKSDRSHHLETPIIQSHPSDPVLEIYICSADIVAISDLNVNLSWLKLKIQSFT